MVPLTPLTSKNYQSTIFFLVFHRWHCWRLKKYEKKYFKRGTGLIADGAVDTVDIKKLFINFFFLEFHRWHRWRLKKHEDKYFKRDTGLIADGFIDTVDIKKLIHQPIFFSVFHWWLHWCLWHLKNLILQRSFEIHHILSFLLIHTVQILIWMFSALR